MSSRYWKTALAAAQQLVPEIEQQVSDIIGAGRVRALRADLEALRHGIAADNA